MQATEQLTRASSGPAVLKPIQIRRLLALPDRRRKRGKRDAGLLAVLACGGLRLGECCRLTIADIEIGKRLRITTKTAKSRLPRFRTITLPNPASKLLRDWLAQSESRFWVFPGRRNEALSTRQAGRIVKAYLRQIGRSDLRPHSLRHSVGAIVTRQSGIWVAQKVLGHASPTTTSRFYSAFDVTDADIAADKLEEAMR